MGESGGRETEGGSQRVRKSEGYFMHYEQKKKKGYRNEQRGRRKKRTWPSHDYFLSGGKMIG